MKVRQPREGKPACLYISRYAPERSPTDPYFGLPRFLSEHCSLTGIWGRSRRTIPFAGRCNRIVNVGTAMRHLPKAVIETIKTCLPATPDFIVCCIEDFALILGWVASRCTGRPYWVVAEDPPFSGRYAVNHGLWRRLERGFRRWLVRRLLASSSGVFCFIERQALHEFLPNGARVIQLTTGVSDEAFEWVSNRHTTFGQREKRAGYTVGYVGAIDLEQGILELFQAVSMARQSVPNLHLRLIGEIDPQWRVEFNAALARFDLRSVVEITGWLSYSDMLRQLLDCDVCCYLRRASLWAESAYPLKICEYLGAARPAVSWDYPGCRALLGSNRFGLLVAPGNINLLAKMLVNISDSSVRQGIEEAIRENMENLLARVSYRKLLDTVIRNDARLVGVPSGG
jgi:glycosyltransferase involved in cell wall biosynthesis